MLEMGAGGAISLITPGLDVLVRVMIEGTGLISSDTLFLTAAIFLVEQERATETELALVEQEQAVAVGSGTKSFKQKWGIVQGLDSLKTSYSFFSS